MARRRRGPARGWHFWRRAFWTRPVLLALYAVVLGLAALLILLTVPGRVGDAIGMAGASECPRSAVRPQVDVDPPQGCLERVEVVLSGPHYRRGPGSEWWLEVDGRVYADVDLSSAASSRLDDGDQAAALLWEGDPVVIEPSSGGRVETENWGFSGWLIWLYIGLFVLSGSLLLLEAGRLKRSTPSGGWSVDGEEIGLVPVVSPVSAAAVIAGAPAMLGLLPLIIVGGPMWSVVLALAGLVLAILAAVKHLRTASGPARV